MRLFDRARRPCAVYSYWLNHVNYSKWLNGLSKPLVNVINLIIICVYISGFLVGSKALTVIHVRLVDRAGNPLIFGVYCGVPSIYIGFGRYYGLFNCVLMGRLLVGSNAVAFSTPRYYT